ncbi:MAG TPA: fibronectin type III domain-containing protein [Spirochaetota bacterium]|nr:fibronectin type III domain-containing protein [Spirochaetota bacterium]
MKVKYILFIFVYLLFLYPDKFTIKNFNKLLYKKKNFIITAGKLKANYNQNRNFWSAAISFDEKPSPVYSRLPLYSDYGYKGRSAEFLTSHNMMVVTNPPGEFFNGSPDIGSFNFAFSVYLYDVRDGYILLQKHGPVLDTVSDKIIPQGIIVKIDNSTICCIMENFFHFKNRHRTVLLDKGPPLYPRKWYRFVISYHAVNGTLCKIRNGKQTQRVYTSEDGSEYATIYYPSFLPQNNYPLEIGKNFQGLIDELEVSMQQANSAVSNKKKGYISLYTSDVFKINSFIKLNALYFSNYNTIPDTDHLQVFLRTARHYFLPENEELKWKQVPVNKKIKKVLNADYINYLQFRLVLKKYSSREALILPPLFSYTQDEKPLTPVIREVKALNRGVRLKWRISSETDIKKYKIYYKKNNFTGLKKYIEVFRKDIKPAKGKEVSYTVNNLQNGTLYYFSLTAFDNNRESAYAPVKKVIPIRYSEAAR